MTLTDVKEMIAETQLRFDQCMITLCVLGIEFVKKPKYFTGFKCGVRGLFSGHHLWFTDNQCTHGVGSSIVPITVYIIDDVVPGKGCGIPGTNYIVIDKDASNATIAHEIGHLADLWKHSSDPDNVMYSPTSDNSLKFTKNQCCMIRTSRYTTLSSYFGCSSKKLRGRVLSDSSSSCCGGE